GAEPPPGGHRWQGAGSGCQPVGRRSVGVSTINTLELPWINWSTYDSFRRPGCWNLQRQKLLCARKNRAQRGFIQAVRMFGKGIEIQEVAKWYGAGIEPARGGGILSWRFKVF